MKHIAGCVTPVILAGGLGTRLKPLTSDKSPKPFLRLLSRNSLFQETVLRAGSYGAPVIICHENYLSLVKRHLAEIGVKPRMIIVEPDHKGTAAAIAQAAFFLKNQGERMLIMPSDHVLEHVSELERCVAKAESYAERSMILIGAVPERPETGYGYITYDAQNMTEERAAPCAPVQSFVEKPSQSVADAMIKAGQCYWNTGIFVARPKVFLSALQKNAPEIYKYAERAYYAGKIVKDTCYPNRESFLRIPSLSVDYAVMEHIENAYVCGMHSFWSDVGTWPQVFRVKFQKLTGLKKRKNSRFSKYKNAS